MCRYPIREIATIHDEAFSLTDRVLKPGENPLAHLAGDLFDIDLTIDLTESTCSQVVLNLRGNTVKYDVTGRIIHSVGSEVPLQPRAGRVEIRSLMDRLSIETYGNRGEVSITNIAYQDGGTPGLGLHAVGGEAKIASLTVHKVRSIWK